jgi:hypothetical protein
LLSIPSIDINIVKTILKQLIVRSCLCLKIQNYSNTLYFEDSLNGDIYEGLKFSIEQLNNYVFLSLNVSYFSLNSNDYTFTKINKQISPLFNKQQYEKLHYLINKIFEDKLDFNYFNSNVSFSQNQTGFGAYFSNDKLFPSGIFLDTLLTNGKIKNEVTEKSINHFKIFESSGAVDYTFSPDIIKIGIISPKEKQSFRDKIIQVLCNGTKDKKNQIYPEFNGFESFFGKKIMFYPLEYSISGVTTMNPKDACDRFIRGCSNLVNNKQVDIVLICLSKELECIKKDENGFDFHDYLKLKCASKYKTQIITENALETSDNINKKFINLATAIYTKTIGIPWKPLEYDKNTVYLGIGFGITPKGITMGCSQLFDGSGQGLKLLLSKVSDESKKNPHLSKQEAYNVGIKIRELYSKTGHYNDITRVVIHKTTSFRKEEIEGFKQSFIGIEDFELYWISEKINIKGFSMFKNDPGFYPIARGTALQIADNELLIWTDGTIKNIDVIPDKNHYQSARGIPKPILVKKYYGKSSIELITNDILTLTKMNFNSADVIYTKMPVTISYANVVTQIIKQGELEDYVIDFQYIM